MRSLNSGPIPAREAVMENLPSVRDYERRFLSLETTAPEQSDIEVLFKYPALRDPTEVGAWKRAVTEEVESEDLETKQSKLIMRIRKRFEEQRDSFIQTLIAKTELPELKESNREMIETLERLKEIVRQNDADNMLELRGGMNFLRMGNRSDVGEEASRSLASLINEIKESKRLTRDQQEAISKTIKDLLDQQLAVHEVVTRIGSATRYEQLSEAAKDHVWRLFANKAYKEEIGTIERNQSLRIMCRRAGAPMQIFKGWERDVYQALQDAIKVKDELAQTDDPEKRASLQAQLEQLKEDVRMGVSSITHKDRATWAGPTGEEQVKNGGWAEMRHVIDSLREPDSAGDRVGKTKRGFVFATASTSQASWESMAMKTQIYFEYGIAKNAWKHINLLTENEFVSRFAVDRATTDDPEMMSAEDAQKRLGEDVKSLEKKQREKTLARNQANSNTVDLEREVTSLERVLTSLSGAPLSETAEEDETDEAVALAAVTAGTLPPRKKQKNRQDNRASTEIGEVTESLRRTREQLRTVRNEREAAEQELGQLSGQLSEKQTALEAANVKAAELNDPTKRATRQVALKRAQYGDLMQKLREYLESGSHIDFYTHFTKSQVQTIARLNGVEYDDKNKVLKQKLAEDCEVGDFSGDYCFINADNLGEQNGRLSNDVLARILQTGRSPEVERLIAGAKDKNKIIIVTSFGNSNDVDGGMIARKAAGVGREFDQGKAEEMMEAMGWSAVDLFENWLDDPNIQRALGARPEEIEERYATNLARMQEFRLKYFSGRDGWTMINTNIGSSTKHFFEMTIRRLVDANCDLTRQGFRNSPFFRQLERSNEYTVTITDDNMEREVRWRGQKLNERENAPRTLIARVYKSLMNELQLYYNRSQIGGVTTSVANGMTEDDIQKMGAFVAANQELLYQKMIKLRSIADHPAHSDAERLQMLIDFRENDMRNLTYDLLDENGEFIEEAQNEELWQHYNANSQWLGKLKRNLRESMRRYALTESNANATEEEIEIAEVDYQYHLNERRNFEIRQKALGMQAVGRFADMDKKELGQFFAKNHAKIAVDEMLNLQEEQMRARFEHSSDLRPTMQNYARRLVGKLSKNRIADFARAWGNRMGIGDRFLREVDISLVNDQVKFKMDTEIFRRASAHYAHAIQTGYQNRWSGVFNPNRSNMIYDNAIGVEMSPTGRAYMGALEKRISEDIGDAIDRTIGNNIHVMIKAGKNRGWNVDELMKGYLDARMNDTQEVEYRNGQYQYDFYGRGDRESAERLLRGRGRPGDAENRGGTRISQLDWVFMQETRKRLRHSGWTPNINFGNLGAQPSLTDTRYVGYRHTNPTATTQRTEAERDTAGLTNHGRPIPVAGYY